jgi:erythronate-4-phosphate dehydrogenase
MKIVADDKIPFIKGVFEPFCDIEYRSAEEINSDLLSDTEILIIRTRTICNEHLLKGTAVKFIFSATIGVDHIDTNFCDDNNILWKNAPGCNAGGVLQWVLLSLVTFSKENKIDLSERILGVVGVGNVGRKIVRMADALGMGVLLNDPPREELEGGCIFRSIETLMRECDIFSLHTPLTTEGNYSTFHMVNKKFLGKLKPDTIILNSSRGEVVLTTDLISALENGRLGAALLDVWEGEPNISFELLKNAALATPHIAGYSLEGKANATIAAVRSIAEYLNLPLNNWVPEDEVLEERQRLKIDCSDKSIIDVIYEFALKVYNIRLDDEKLRNAPGNFEALRKNYNFRRENSYWILEVSNASKILIESLKMLEFSVEEQ